MIISILGCGWLGLPLGEHLRDNGHTIKGSTTSTEKLQILKGKNIQPYHITLNPTLNDDAKADFWDANLLILNIPPGRGQNNVETYHDRQIQAIVEQLRDSSITKVIFVSSTSVYPEKPGLVAEADAQAGQAVRSSGNALLKAEKRLLECPSFDTTVLRFGGLYGYERHPIKHLAGRTELSKGGAPVNLIHLDDCIAIIQKIIEKDISNQIFNAVSDGHPPKDMYYPAIAREHGYEPPTYKENEDESEDYKIVSNTKLKQQLNYTFKYPNPMDF